MGTINCPEYSMLEEPFRLEGLPGEVKKSFYELARSRVRVVPQDEHFQFERDIFGDDWQQSSAVYVTSTNEYKTSRWNLFDRNKSEIRLNGLDISINKDFFVDGNRDCSDLIPYAAEHEIFEAWLSVKPGYQTKDPQKNHLLARVRQFEMAMEDGKAEKLLEFYKRINHLVGNELDYAYQKASKKCD